MTAGARPTREEREGLIAEARHHLQRTRVLTGEGYDQKLVARLADALEAAPVVDEARIAEVIEEAIDGLPHARRLYPDIYAAEVARAVVTKCLRGGR